MEELEILSYSPLIAVAFYSRGEVPTAGRKDERTSGGESNRIPTSGANWGGW